MQTGASSAPFVYWDTYHALFLKYTHVSAAIQSFPLSATAQALVLV
jgi:hypothetical protein